LSGAPRPLRRGAGRKKVKVSVAKSPSKDRPEHWGGGGGASGVGEMQDLQRDKEWWPLGPWRGYLQRRRSLKILMLKSRMGKDQGEHRQD